MSKGVAFDIRLEEPRARILLKGVEDVLIVRYRTMDTFVMVYFLMKWIEPAFGRGGYG
jgi:hypothetical protein